ncbi:MAG: hypothetical protein AABW56_04915 [Nanoarchaeota archaeon]
MYSENLQQAVNKGWKVLNIFKIADEEIDRITIGSNFIEAKINGFPKKL